MSDKRRLWRNEIRALRAGSAQSLQRLYSAPRMHVCLVLGAGATLANALFFHRTRLAAKNPPLDYTFFEKVAALKVPIPTELRSYATAMPGPNPFDIEVGRPQYRMEEFFKEVFGDFQDSASPTAPAALAYEQLVALYTRVLRETTDWIGADGLTGGPVGRVLAAAADVSDQLTVVTFNHDLVIENEIVKRARLKSRWCIEQGYGAFSKALFYSNPPTGDLFARHSAACDHTKPLVLLKLHGSLNWYVRMNGAHPSRAMLTGNASGLHVRCTRRRTVPHQLRSTRPATKKLGRASWYTWPVVIPPVYNKEALVRSLVAQVWADASAAVASADRLAFIGYSMPALDVGAERLFRRGVAGNNRLAFVDVVNPGPEAAQRYGSIVSPKGVHWSYSIDSFLAGRPFA
jgi:hypothetical protein